MRHILLYKTGEADPQLAAELGDYEGWFARVLDGIATIEVHRAFEAPMHLVGGYDGMVISGSPRSLVEPEPWMEVAAECVRAAAAAGVPVLGVCFGHQLIGVAFGGRVRQNPNGWEVGAQEIELTDAGTRDLLFDGSPSRLRVYQSHRDEVSDLEAAARVLAVSDHTATQALAVGTHVRGVQFHPEMTATVVRRVMRQRHALLVADAAPRGRCIDGILAGLTDTFDGERVLHNFVRHFIRKS